MILFKLRTILILVLTIDTNEYDDDSSTRPMDIKVMVDIIRTRGHIHHTMVGITYFITLSIYVTLVVVNNK